MGIKEVDLNTIHMSYFTLPLSPIDKLEIKRWHNKIYIASTNTIMNQEKPEHIFCKIIITSIQYGTWNFSHNKKIREWIKGIQTGKGNVKLF